MCNVIDKNEQNNLLPSGCGTSGATRNASRDDWGSSSRERQEGEYGPNKNEQSGLPWEFEMKFKRCDRGERPISGGVEVDGFAISLLSGVDVVAQTWKLPSAIPQK